MYDWIPDICREIHSEIQTCYWVMLVPFALFMMVLEYFKLPEQGPDMMKVIKRVFISIVLLITFNEIANIIAVMGEGLADKIGGLSDLKGLMDKMLTQHQNTEISWLKFKESCIFILSLLSYVVAYLGIFIADALIHYVWAILYVVSPLMILMYVSDKTAAITGNLYRSLITVMVWKVLWSILAIFLFRMADGTLVRTSQDDFLTLILMNLFVGLSMLFIPMATKSLLTDGFSGLASGFAAIGAGAVMRTAAPYAKALVKSPVTYTRYALGHHTRQIKSAFSEKNSDNNNPPPNKGGHRGK